jgi:hypothetical protein
MTLLAGPTGAAPAKHEPPFTAEEMAVFRRRVQRLGQGGAVVSTPGVLLTVARLIQIAAPKIWRDEAAVLNAIRLLRPSRASGWPIWGLAEIGAGRTYVALARLERAGRITSGWADGPTPRRRLYQVAVTVGPGR